MILNLEYRRKRENGETVLGSNAAEVLHTVFVMDHQRCRRDHPRQRVAYAEHENCPVRHEYSEHPRHSGYTYTQQQYDDGSFDIAYAAQRSLKDLNSRPCKVERHDSTDDLQRGRVDGGIISEKVKHTVCYEQYDSAECDRHGQTQSHGGFDTAAYTVVPACTVVLTDEVCDSYAERRGGRPVEAVYLAGERPAG